MKKVFITGGDGFLGINLLKILTQEDYEVTVMVQPGRSAEHLQRYDVQSVEADLADYASIHAAMAGAEVVIHLAAVATAWPSRHAIYQQINVEGTRHMIRAAQAHGVERFLHVGSARSVFQPGTRDKPGTEADRTPVVDTGFEYSDSKRDGQMLVEQAAREEGFPAITLCPTFMIGPEDAKPGTGQLLMNIWAGKVPFSSPGSKNWIDVRDVAQAIVNAIDRGRLGESYLLGHENLSYQAATQIMAAQLGVKSPTRPAPRWAVLAAGRLGNFVSRFTRRQPYLSLPMARIACEEQVYDCSKAIEELDLPQTPIERAFQDSIGWFRAHGTFERLFPHYEQPLQGKVVWVTGSNQGVGKALALRLGTAGAKVVLNGRREALLRKTEDEFLRMGLDVLALPGDVTDWDQCADMVGQILAHFGQLDVLVNNAALSTRGGLQEMVPSVIETITRVNLLGTLFPTKAALPALEQSQGYVLNMSSFAAFYGIPYNSLYSSTKSALTQLTQALSLELEGKGIDLGVIYLGFIENDPQKVILDSNGKQVYLSERKGVKKQSPAEVSEAMLKMVLQRSRHRVSSPLGAILGIFSSLAPNLIRAVFRRRLSDIRSMSAEPLKQAEAERVLK